jgi:hypothetical protein
MVTAPVSSYFEKIFQDTGLSLDDSSLQCWAAGKPLVSLNKFTSSHCRVKSKSTIGHDTSMPSVVWPALGAPGRPFVMGTGGFR